MPSSEPAGFRIRDYVEADRAAANALGTHVLDWWYATGSGNFVHLIAEKSDTGEIIGHLQARDCSVPAPSRRPEQCHFNLNVAAKHRRQGIGAALYDRVEHFARQRRCRLLYTAYIETPDAPAAPFLRKRGFEPLEWFYPSYLDVAAFDPARFDAAIRHTEAQGICLLTYAEVEDTSQNRTKLYELEQTAHTSQPFIEVEPYVPTPYAEWESEFVQRDKTAIFLAIAPDDTFVGVVTGLEWYFTGVHPEWCGKGVATALKVLCISEAKERGIVRMETENHSHNAAMLAVNRKLGFVFTTPEVACVKRL